METSIMQPAHEALMVTAGSVPKRELTVGGLITVLRRRFRLILCVVLFITGMSGFIGSHLTSKYTAKALVMIEPGDTRMPSLNLPSRELVVDNDMVETQIKLLTSASHIDRVIEFLDLGRDAEFQPEHREPLLAGLGARWPTLANLLSAQWLRAQAGELIAQLSAADLTDSVPKPPQLPPQAARDDREAVDRLIERRLKVVQEGRSHVIAVSFTSSDPAKAALVANTFAQLYVEDQATLKRLATEEATDWLSTRIDKLRSDVEEAEAKVQRYRVANRLARAGQTDVTDQKIADINRELVAAKAELAARTARLAFIHDMRQRGHPLDTLPEVTDSLLIVELRGQETELMRREAELAADYGKRHPRMAVITRERERVTAKIDNEVARIVSNIENQVDIAAARVKTIEASAKEALLARDEGLQAQVQLDQLEREAGSTRTLYEHLLQRYKEIREQSGLIEADARVVAAANPPSVPSTPGPGVFVAAGLFASTIGATLLAVLLERLNNRLRSEEDVRDILGLPALALVPILKRLSRGREPHEYLLRRPLSVYTETIRAVFSSLQLGNMEGQTQSVLLTSALPGEGKSTLALSLAAFAAQTGIPVLLIDFDIRRPVIAKRLGLANNPGLLDYILGEASLIDIIQHHEESGIRFIGAGRPTRNPAALLQSQRLARLLSDIRADNLLVVIDSPPALGITDPRLLAAHVDKVLLAIHWNTTKVGTARSTVALLQQAQAKLAGVVLTKVDLRRFRRLGYEEPSSYYRKYHEYYVN